MIELLSYFVYHNDIYFIHLSCRIVMFILFKTVKIAPMNKVNCLLLCKINTADSRKRSANRARAAQICSHYACA